VESYACAFFFQAEDGIRYRNVTGVQTCALPILVSHVSSGTTLPVASIASRPSSSGTNSGTASPLACSASSTACTVGATISGPMPSPCHTPRRQLSVLAMPSTLGLADRGSTGPSHYCCVLPEPDVRK